MALWKPFRGNRAGLDVVEKHDGYVYFCVDDGSLFFDYTDADGILQRKQINAKDCESIMGMSLDELKAELTTQDAVILHEAQSYTDNALAQAKENGDLKGEKGDDGVDGISATHSWSGTTLTITSASGTSSADLKGEKGDQGEPGADGEKGADGAKGEDGYTPVRGTDYWTDADKAEIKSYVDDAILNGAW